MRYEPSVLVILLSYVGLFFIFVLFVPSASDGLSRNTSSFILSIDVLRKLLW